MSVSSSSRYLRHRRARESGLHQRIIKRTFDLTVCIILLPILLLLMILIAVSILIDSPGSPILFEERIGLGGRLFRVCKFRTRVSSDRDRRQGASAANFIPGRDRFRNRSRPQEEMTLLGRYLRKSSLDELPQIINVIKGEMSLIGPRPTVPREVDRYEPWHYERLHALPGITGMAQLMERSRPSFDQAVRFDIQYVRSQSLALDMWIIWRTLRALFSDSRRTRTEQRGARRAR